MYQRSSTLYGFFCKSPAVWAAIQRQTSVQPLDHTCTAAATYWHTNTHTHTVGPRLNICPACPDSPFWTLIAASNMKTHTHIYTHILWKRWLCRYFVTPDGDVTAHSSINGQLPFHGGQARDEGPHKPDYTKLQFSQNQFLENCRLLTLCNFSFSKSKTQEHKSKEGLKSGFICSDVSYNRIACLTFWLKESWY